MADAISKLEILVKLRDEATREMGRLSDEVKNLDVGFKNAGWSAGVMAGALAAMAGATIWKAIDAFGESEVQMARFDAMVKTLPPALQQYRGELLEAANKALDFGFSNEAAAVTLVRLLSATGNIDLAMGGLQAAMDLARFKGIGLEEAAQALILAFQGNSRMLNQLGIDVDEHASKETILAAVLQKVGGQAEAYSGTMRGATDTLRVYGGEVLEAIGKSLGFRDAVVWVRDRVVGWIREQGGLNAVLEKYPGIITIISSLLAGVFIVAMVAGIGIVMAKVAAFGLLLAAGAALGAWISTFVLLWKGGWEDIKWAFGIVADWLIDKFNWLKDKFWEAVGWIEEKLRGFVDTLENIGNKITTPFKEAGAKVGEMIGKIPGFQFGGIVTRPTLAMVGEAGPEAIIPLRRAGGGFGGEINIYLSGTFYTEEEMAEKFANQIAKLIKYQLRI